MTMPPCQSVTVKVWTIGIMTSDSFEVLEISRAAPEVLNLKAYVQFQTRAL